MAINDFNLGLIGKLDGTKSKHQLNNDIEALKKQLNNVEITAKLDPKVLGSIQIQLQNLQLQLNNVTVSQSALNGLVSQINSVLQHEMQISSINIGGQTTNQARQAGQQIGNIVSDEVNNALGKVTSKEIGIGFTVEKTASDEFNNAVDEEIRKLQQANNKLNSVRYTTNTERQEVTDIFGNVDYEHVEKLTGAVFRYNTETGEAITKTMKWAQIGMTVDDKGNDVPLMGWVQGLTTYNKSLEEATVKTDNFIDKRKKAVSDFEIDLQKIQSRVADQGVGKPIKDQIHIDALETQYNEVNSAIQRLNTSTKDTFTDTRIEVEKAIATLENLERQYRNAETTATSLRSKDIATVKSQYSSKLDVLVEKMQSSGVYSNGFQKGADNLRNVLGNATDSTGLTQFLNGLDKLEAGYKRAKASADAFNQSQKVGIKVSGLESSISDLQRISPEIDKFEADINGAKVTVKSLGEDLSKVSTQSDFSVVNEKWKAFTKAAQSAGIAISEVATKSDSLTEKVNKIQLLSNGGIKNDYATQIAQLEGNFRRLGLSQEEVSQKTSKVSTAFGELKTRVNQPFDESNYQEIINLNDVLQRELIESSNEYTKLQASFKGFATEQQRLSLANTIEAWNQKNTKATREVVDENHKYIMSLRDLSTEMRKVDFDRINTGFKQNENSMRAMNRLGKSLKEQFKQAYESFTMWLSASSLVMKVVSKTNQAITELKDVNTLLTEISKANDKLTKEQLAKIADDGFDTASKYGKKVTDYLSGVQEASRAGYENAEAIAELSVAIQGAGDVTEEVANSYVIATDKAYKLGGSVEALTEVFDGTNKITNLNAVNMSELAEAMTIVGSTAASFGVEVDETTAAIATMSAVTQQSGSEVARAFRAILLNIRQVSDEEEGIDAEGLTKYEKACNALGVSLKETKNGVLETRDAMDVLKELSEEYVKLDENDLRRTELLNSVGGKVYHVMQKCITRMYLIAGNPLEPCTTI